MIKHQTHHRPTAHRLTIAAVAAAMTLAPVAQSRASMDDFLNAAGAQYNVTPAGVYQSSTVGAATGGGFVFKAPRKTFTPFGYVPPSLKAGCGGIDFFGGAISLPSKAEFMNFLRGVGTAIPGLAFELALKNLSPDFSEEVKSYWTKFQEIANGTIDSCEAAQAIVEATGMGTALKSFNEEAQKFLRSPSGGSADGAAARISAAADFTKIEDAYRAKTPLQKQGRDPDTGLPSGFNQDDIEINLMWAVINSGKYASMTQREKEELMSMVGTVVLRKARPVDGDKDNNLDATPFDATTTAIDLLGRIDTTNPAATTSVKRLDCGTDTVACLSPTVSPESIVGVGQRVYNTAKKIQQGLLTRDRSAFTVNDMYLLTSYSSVPILQLIQSTAFQRYAALSSDILVTYSELAAFEIVLNYTEDALSTLRRLLVQQKARTKLAHVETHAADRIARLEADMQKLRDKRTELDAKIKALAATQQWMEHIESRIRQSLTDDLRRNLTFSNALARG